MKKYLYLLLLPIFAIFATSCDDDSDDMASLRGKSFKCNYESSSYAYCMTFDSNSTGRWFRLAKTSSGYTYDDNSISNFTYEYDYPQLSVVNEGGTSMLSSHYDFLSSDVYSDGNYTWTEVNLKELISSGTGGNQGGSSSGESTTYGKLSVSPSSVTLDGGAGSRSIVVTSNTNWSVAVNNSGSGIDGLKVSTTSGSGNGTVVVSYDAVTTQYYQQHAVITFYYIGAGNVKLSQSVSINRRKLP